MNDPGVALEYVLCDEETVTWGSWRHSVLVVPALRLQETHLLVVRRGEDLFLLGCPRQLTREDLLLYVRIWADFRDLKGDTLVHHFRIEVFSFDFFALVLSSREELDWVWIGEGG